MNAHIKIRMIQIAVSEFGTTQATEIRYRTNRGSQGTQGTVYASFDYTARQVEKLVEMLTEEGCHNVNVHDLRPQECIVT